MLVWSINIYLTGETFSRFAERNVCEETCLLQLGILHIRFTKGGTQLNNKEKFHQEVKFEYGEGLPDDIKMVCMGPASLGTCWEILPGHTEDVCIETYHNIRIF